MNGHRLLHAEEERGLEQRAGKRRRRINSAGKGRRRFPTGGSVSVALLLLLTCSFLVFLTTTISLTKKHGNYHLGATWSYGSLVNYRDEESVSLAQQRKRQGPAIAVTPTTIHRQISSFDELQSLPASTGDNINGNNNSLLVSSFCTTWDVDVDEWWTTHFDWTASTQNVTHQCFRHLLQPPPKDDVSAEDKTSKQRIQLLRNLYSTQHRDRRMAPLSFRRPQQQRQRKCFYRKYVSGSGFALDVSHVIDGLIHAASTRQPVQLVLPERWQYLPSSTVSALNSSQQRNVCSTLDLDCYFLPLLTTECDSAATATNVDNNFDQTRHPEIRHLYQWRGFHRPISVSWILEYATRPRTWLRQRAAEVAARVGLPKDGGGADGSLPSCTVLHVRRADVVLHGKFSRRYHAIDEYLQACRARSDRNRKRMGNTINKDDKTVMKEECSTNFLLLTDDENAITEATSRFPQYNWYYIDRPRHRGSSGGWENQIPSSDPLWEVVVLHATFLLIQQHCNRLIVHSKSNLADYYYALMMLANPDGADRIDIDKNREHDRIHSWQNAETVSLSQDVW